MKALRVGVCGLVVAACFAAAAPLAGAAGGEGPARPAIAAAGEWIAGWVARLLERLGWGGEPRGAVGRADGDSGCHIDPSGNRVCGPPAPAGRTRAEGLEGRAGTSSCLPSGMGAVVRCS